MGNDLASYRSAIGLFHMKLQRLSKSYVFITRPVQLLLYTVLGFVSNMKLYINKYVHSLNTSIYNFKFSFIVVLLTCHSYHHHPDLHFQAHYDYSNDYSNDIIPVFTYFTIIVQFLLILSGDVELNPGPNMTLQHSTISIFHQNIRSIRNKFDYIKSNFLDYDILCFTESKLSVDIHDNTIMLEGFDKFYRKDNSSFSGGLITYITEFNI